MMRGSRYGGRGWTRSWVAAAVLASAVTVAGCDGQEVPPPPAGSSTGTAAGTPATTPTGTSPTGTPGETVKADDPAPDEVLVEVNVDGGIAGVVNQLVVRQDGSYTVRHGTTSSRHGRMTPAQVAELRAALEDPAYAKVPARPTGEPAHDGFRYIVTYKHRLVVATDGGIAPALGRVFAALPEGGPPTGP
ncbi:hypothetical protein GPZ77_23525 [Streptomyces sp. QHH-9511]|uniref:hypothetical protein n=1 Tax=Streptomyces sp. QHH-9511 TaxID=2684468 RepID=UPI0013173356|nr:hypothetical protein [Streptomyces sp. QHH-9511]QGZ50947.1 hypothetical protein GPZ77_23525 [Streptomyces sp. QHH-9511]